MCTGFIRSLPDRAPYAHTACPCRYWNDPEVLGKLGKAMGGSFDLPNVGEGEEGEGEDKDEEDETIVAAASAGGGGACWSKLQITIV